MNPTTQLVEAIYDIVWAGSEWSKLPERMNKVEEEAALRLAIADAVDGWIGEDGFVVYHPAGVKSVISVEQRARNDEKARMRTFTAALREGAK